MLLKYILVILAIHATCNSEIVIVELANGGKSHPLVIKPLKDSHNHDIKDDYSESQTNPRAYALYADYPTDTDSVNGDDSDIQHTETATIYVEESDDGNPTEALQIDQSTEGSLVTSDEETVTTFEKEQELEDITDKPEKDETLESNPPDLTTTIRAITSTTNPPSTPSTIPAATTLPPETTSTPSFPTHSPEPTVPCHNVCSKALNETRLYTQPKSLLGQGSDLTLVCELPLDSSFILEELIWLYHPENSPTHQCSLTTKEFLPSCDGFQTIKDTDDRNDTFKRESITLTNMLTNYSGQYMCQVKLTCCPTSHEHIMSQEKIVRVRVQVWLADYTSDLAIAGSITAALAILVLGGSYCISRRQKVQYSFITDDIQDSRSNTVLHIPLVEEQDNDSFDSNFDENE